MDGLELLAWLRQQPRLKDLRFVMLSSSGADKDVQAAQRLGADDYRVKPSRLLDLTQIVKEVSEAADQPINSTTRGSAT